MLSAAEKTSPSVPETLVIKNHLGEFTVDVSKILHFPGGMIGFPEMTEFAVMHIPGNEQAEFKLLLCLNDPKLNFVVLPMPPQNCPVDMLDIQDAAKTLDVAIGDVGLLFVVTTRRFGETMKVSMNARAPIIINTVDRLACQYVLPNTKYSVQHAL